MYRRLVSGFLVILMFCSTDPMAAKPVYGPPEAPPPKPVYGPPEAPKTFEEKALNIADKISGKIERAAEKIDITLAGGKYTKKLNPTRVEVRQLVAYGEGGTLRTATDFGVDLRLPNLEKRWQLRFSSYDKNREDRDISQKRVRTRPRERDYGAGLFFFQKLGRVRTMFQPRLQLKSPLEMNYILRFESDAEVKPFKVTPRIEFYADANKGTGEYGSLEFRFKLADKWELTLPNAEEYRANGQLFTTQHGIEVDYALSDTEGLGAGVTTGANNQGAFHLDTLTASVSYSQQIYKDRLTYSLSPFLLFAKSQHFKGSPGISLTVDLTF